MSLPFGSDLRAADHVFGEFGLSVGMDHGSGDYALAKDTDILYLPVSLRYERFSWRVTVTLSYLRITGPGGVIGGGIQITFKP
jgi:hypothetical protein